MLNNIWIPSFSQNYDHENIGFKKKKVKRSRGRYDEYSEMSTVVFLIPMRTTFRRVHATKSNESTVNE